MRWNRWEGRGGAGGGSLERVRLVFAVEMAGRWRYVWSLSCSVAALTSETCVAFESSYHFERGEPTSQVLGKPFTRPRSSFCLLLFLYIFLIVSVSLSTCFCLCISVSVGLCLCPVRVFASLCLSLSVFVKFNCIMCHFGLQKTTDEVDNYLIQVTFADCKCMLHKFVNYEGYCVIQSHRTPEG